LAATPIGNAPGITLRALETLHHPDMIACEDTRVSRSLLIVHNIVTPTLSYHEHNAAHIRLRVLGRLRQGEAVAMLTDASMPLISDPGFELVRACLDKELPSDGGPRRPRFTGRACAFRPAQRAFSLRWISACQGGGRLSRLPP
jgi:16S rRNA (cytidine(1402)-2'-O)-methyltransferase